MKNNKIGKLMLALSLSLAGVTYATISTHNHVVKANTTYPITVNTENFDGDQLERTFSSNEQLGYPEGWGGSNWHIRTYRKVFLGYSTDQNALENQSRIFSKDATIEDVLESEGTLEGKTLYPLFIDQFQAMNTVSDVSADTGDLVIGFGQNGSDVVGNATAKNIIGFNPTENSSNSAVTDNVSNREVFAFYQSNTNNYSISTSSTFGWKTNLLPNAVYANPLSILGNANGVSDFSGENPLNYTYMDLKVNIDERLDVATEMNNLGLVSPLFKVAKVLDENYQELDTTLEPLTPGSELSSFSFKNPNKLKTFIVRTVLREGTGMVNPAAKMTLNSGDANNITVSNATALDFVMNNGRPFVLTGSIKGGIKINKAELGMAGILVGDNYAIEENIAKNQLEINFVANTVTFDKNLALFDGKVQENSIEKVVKVGWNESINNDALTTETMPNDLANLVVDEKTYVFKGWNTKADGSGEMFTGESLVNEADMTVYAMWEAQPEKPVEPPFEPEIKPEQPVKPEIKPEQPQNDAKKAVDTSDMSSLFMVLGSISLVGLLKLRKK